MDPAVHLFWFAPYNLVCPSTRYRGKYPLDFIKLKNKFSFHFYYPQRNAIGLLKFLFLIIQVLFFTPKTSIIVIQKVCTGGLYAKALKLLIRYSKLKSIFDIDDAEHLRNAPETLHFFLKNCDTIHVGSEALYIYCRRFNDCVRILTSPVIAHPWRKTNRKKRMTIGWVGDFGNGLPASASFSHKTSLYQLVFPYLRQIDFPIKLVLIGIKNPEDIPEIERYFFGCEHIELCIPVHLNWTKDSWIYEQIPYFDIGISPLVDHPFNQAKSAFKAKQYLSCGVPVIGSDIGENETFIHHKKNGFLVRSGRDFIEALNTFKNMSTEQYKAFSNYALDQSPSFSIEQYVQQFEQSVLDSKQDDIFQQSSSLSKKNDQKKISLL